MICKWDLLLNDFHSMDQDEWDRLMMPTMPGYGTFLASTDPSKASFFDPDTDDEEARMVPTKAVEGKEMIIDFGDTEKEREERK